MKAKRVIWVVVIFLVFLSALGHAEEPKPIYKNVISCDLGNVIAYIPVSRILQSVVFFPSFSFAYERRLNNLIGLRGKIELLLPFLAFSTVVFTDVGVNFYPGKRAQHGWYVGVAGNITFYVRSFSSVDGGVNVGGVIYSGYQWILPSQWVFRLGAGCRAIYYSGGLGFYPNFEAAFGYAF